MAIKELSKRRAYRREAIKRLSKLVGLELDGANVAAVGGVRGIGAVDRPGVAALIFGGPVAATGVDGRAAREGHVGPGGAAFVRQGAEEGVSVRWLWGQKRPVRVVISRLSARGGESLRRTARVLK